MDSVVSAVSAAGISIGTGDTPAITSDRGRIIYLHQGTIGRAKTETYVRKREFNQI